MTLKIKEVELRLFFDLESWMIGAAYDRVVLDPTHIHVIALRLLCFGASVTWCTNKEGKC